MSQTDCLLVARHDAVAQVTLNRPEAGNALSQALQHAIVDTFRQLDTDDGVRAVVLHGAGTRVFCAGLDLSELSQGVDLVNGATDPVAAVAASKKPVIAAVNGAAVTGGLELMLACDFALAANTARFADTHARMGVIPGWGLSQRLQRAVGTGRALQMSLSGGMIDAVTARDWGLVNALHAPEALLDAALDLARQIAAWDPTFVTAYRGLIKTGAGLALNDALLLETQASQAHNSTLDPVALSSRGLRK